MSYQNLKIVMTNFKIKICFIIMNYLIQNFIEIIFTDQNFSHSKI